MEFGVCFRRFLIFGIIIINVIVALLGLVVLIYGGVSLGQGKSYFAIAESTTTFTRVPVLMIIVGLFITAVGVVGTIGAIFSSTAFGRVMLLVYSVVLALLVLCEIGGGIAAGVLRTDVENIFKSSANTTFAQCNTSTGYKTTWDNFQQAFSCCGLVSYTDWYTVLKYESLPSSCCPSQQCNGNNYYQTGCVTQVIGNNIKTYFGGIAAGAIIIALLQVVGIVASCFVAFYKPKDKYEIV